MPKATRFPLLMLNPAKMLEEDGKTIFMSEELILLNILDQEDDDEALQDETLLDSQ
jgi:hypothetical protein